MKIKPLHDRILVYRKQEKDTSNGGIIIPEVAKEKLSEGEVLAVGAGMIDELGARRPLDVKPGDVVLFGKYSGTEVDVDGEQHLIMREEDVLGIVENNGQ